jgi:hypothetical protein
MKFFYKIKFIYLTFEFICSVFLMDTAVKIIFDKITMNKNHSYRIITINFMGVLCLTEQARQACFTIENRQL